MAGDIGTTAMGALVVNFVLQMKGEDGGGAETAVFQLTISDLLSLVVKMTSGLGYSSC